MNIDEVKTPIETAVPAFFEQLREDLQEYLKRAADKAARMEELRRREALTPKEVEELFGLNKHTLRTKRSRGGGPKYFRDGQVVMYRRKDVEEWMEKNLVLTSDQRC